MVEAHSSQDGTTLNLGCLYRREWTLLSQARDVPSAVPMPKLLDKESR